MTRAYGFDICLFNPYHRTCILYYGMLEAKVTSEMLMP